jgi:hypothetical protein
MRGDRTFAYDLDMAHGAVNSRVVLLLRSIEAKPRRFSPVFSYTPSTQRQLKYVGMKEFLFISLHYRRG